MRKEWTGYYGDEVMEEFFQNVMTAAIELVLKEKQFLWEQFIIVLSTNVFKIILKRMGQLLNFLSKILPDKLFSNVLMHVTMLKGS